MARYHLHGKVFVKLDKNSESSVSGTTYEEPVVEQAPVKVAPVMFAQEEFSRSQIPIRLEIQL